MDRHCEFCVNLRSVVYCKADAAYLCLPCDTKVHSANPLSKRHHRTLICESCKGRPTYVLCYDHQKFMCRGCDLSQHDAGSQHRKRVMTSYVGCPSAQDLRELWGFDSNQFADGSSVLDNEFAPANTSVVDLETGTSGSINEQVQISDVDHTSSVICCQEPKLGTDDDQVSQEFLLGGGGPHDRDSSLDPCSSPFAQLDHLASSEAEETTLQEDSFWHCKSPVWSSQLWSQNMQDLGVCEESACLDDLNIPDIDLTFRNFEELFRAEQEPTSISNATATEDTSMTISVTITESSKKARHELSAESSVIEGIDSCVSPSCRSPKHCESAKQKGTKNVQAKDSKQGQYGYRKARSGTQKRAKSPSWKFKSHESTTRSC